MNIASRIESLTKTLKRPVLLSGAVAHLVGHSRKPMGSHSLRGLGGPMEIFSPAAE